MPPTPLIPVRGRVRRTDYVQLSRGLHMPRAGGGQHAALHAWSLVLPASACFTSVTAAGVYGWQLPKLPEDAPVLAAADRRDGRPRRAGIHVFRQAKPPSRLTRAGLPLATPEETLLAAARDLRLIDLLILVDSSLHLGFTRTELVAGVADGRHGGPALRGALTMADGRAESAWETLLRLFHVVCEVPVVPQFEVRSPDGDFVARGDLWIRGTRVLHEYDGGVHRDRDQHRSDLARDRRLSAAGWTRRGYTAVDLLRRPDQILREADSALGRPHDPDRLERWFELLRESTLTSTGMARLRARWKLPPRPHA